MARTDPSIQLKIHYRGLYSSQNIQNIQNKILETIMRSEIYACYIQQNFSHLSAKIADYQFNSLEPFLLISSANLHSKSTFCIVKDHFFVKNAL